MLFSDSAGESREDDDSEKEEEGSEEEEDDGCEDEGMEVLLKEGDNSPPSSSSRPKKEISHIAATAESLQPKGYTLATAKVSLKYSSVVLFNDKRKCYIFYIRRMGLQVMILFIFTCFLFNCLACKMP